MRSLLAVVQAIAADDRLGIRVWHRAPLWGHDHSGTSRLEGPLATAQTSCRDREICMLSWLTREQCSASSMVYLRTDSANPWISGNIVFGLIRNTRLIYSSTSCLRSRSMESPKMNGVPGLPALLGASGSRT